MKIAFKICLLCMIKGLCVVAIAFYLQVLLENFYRIENLKVWDAFSSAFGMIILTILLFSVPLLIAALVRFLLSKNNWFIFISFLINFLVFFIYGYYVFIKSKPGYDGSDLSEYAKYLIMIIFYTLLFLVSSELFIFKKKLNKSD